MKVLSICLDNSCIVTTTQMSGSHWLAYAGNGHEFDIKMVRSRERKALDSCRFFWRLLKKNPEIAVCAWEYILSRCNDGKRVGAVQVTSYLRNLTPSDVRGATGYKVPSQFGSMMLRLYLARNPEKRRLLGIKGEYSSAGLPVRTRFGEDFLFDRRLIDEVPKRYRDLCVEQLEFDLKKSGESQNKKGDNNE